MDFDKYVLKQIKMIKVGALMINKKNNTMRIITEITQENKETMIHHFDFDFNSYGQFPLYYYENELRMGGYEFYA